MRIVLLALAAAALLASPAEARLFMQTFGSTVATPEGGCVWNANQDYFVPRTCDSGQYGLHGACTTRHRISAACHRLHPIYHGYCTPYGGLRYCWRDCLYRRDCGCTPLKCYYGPWRTGHCPRPRCVERPTGGSCEANICSSCVAGRLQFGSAVPGCVRFDGLAADLLPNVEPLGGDVLGTVFVDSLGGDLLGQIAPGSPAAATAAPGGRPAPAAQGSGALPVFGIDLPTLGF